MCVVAQRLLFAAALISSAAAYAEATIEISPAHPVAGEPTYLIHSRLDVCSTKLDAAATQVRFEAGEIVVRFKLRADHRENGCFEIGMRRSVELGRLPAGTYRAVAEFETSPDTVGVITEAPRVASTFTVTPFTAINRPLNDVTGMWWSSTDPGWVLSLYQQPDRSLIAAWPTYDSAGSATWFYFLIGRWVATNVYEAPIARTTNGSYFGRMPPTSGGYLPPMPPDAEVVGTARLSFGDSAPENGSGRIFYTISGISTDRLIQKYRYP